MRWELKNTKKGFKVSCKEIDFQHEEITKGDKMKSKTIQPITDYSTRILKCIKKCKTNKELLEVIDKIYADGFSDGSMNPD